ncbi:uncharacterized protein LOC108960260 [Eucalyptus grandis]|uniref:uncharacterized protein LOC108960260 n=1 Tax=Eucalyptus grandis TaxID=71139 RepID=UPI00192ED2C3|nr:uncharacterized protein LOC108960260 [Eucalyptus grandis]
MAAVVGAAPAATGQPQKPADAEEMARQLRPQLLGSCRNAHCGLRSSVGEGPSPNRAFSSLARKRDSQPELVLKPTIVEEVSAGIDEEEDAVIFHSFDDDALEDEFEDGAFEDEYLEDGADVYVS